MPLIIDINYLCTIDQFGGWIDVTTNFKLATTTRANPDVD